MHRLIGTLALWNLAMALLFLAFLFPIHVLIGVDARSEFTRLDREGAIKVDENVLHTLGYEAADLSYRRDIPNSIAASAMSAEKLCAAAGLTVTGTSGLLLAILWWRGRKQLASTSTQANQN